MKTTELPEAIIAKSKKQADLADNLIVLGWPLRVHLRQSNEPSFNTTYRYRSFVTNQPWVK